MWSLGPRPLQAASCVCVRIEALNGVRGWSLVFVSNGRLFEVSARDRGGGDEEGVDGQKALPMGIGWLSRTLEAAAAHLNFKL